MKGNRLRQIFFNYYGCSYFLTNLVILLSVFIFLRNLLKAGTGGFELVYSVRNRDKKQELD